MKRKKTRVIAKKAAPKKAVKKAAPKKAAKKKATSYHKDTNSHNVKINVMSGLSKIVGVPHKAKYYIDYKLNDVKKIEYFDKLPKGYYKGMDRIIYLMKYTDSGTSLIPIKSTKTDKIIKK